MVKPSLKYLNSIVICPCCKQERRGGEMMCGIKMCKYCFKEKGGN